MRTPDAPSERAVVLRRYVLDSMLLCPQKQNPQLTIHARAMNEAPLFGIVFHKLVDIYISEPTARFRLLTTQGIRTIAQNILNAEQVLTPMPPSWPNELGQALTAWLDQWWEPIGSMMAEPISEKTHVKFLTWVGKTDVWLQGTLDLMAGPRIYDWKTSGKGWADSKAQQGLQAPLYSWLSGLDLPLTFTYVIYNRSNQQWEEKAVPISQGCVTAAVEQAKTLAEMYVRKLFPATPFAYTGSYVRGWWCTDNFCDVWDACGAKFMVPELTTSLANT